MAEAIDIPLEDDDRLAEPPLVDFLHEESAPHGYAITFIPSEGEEPTRSVFVFRDSPEGGLVAAYLGRISELLNDRVVKIVHQGGGDYVLQSATKSVAFSGESWTENWVPEAFDRLKQIADVAEVAFMIVHAH